MHGVAKNAEGFDHFNYVNPDAPKGGTLKFGVTGTFDSLNPFIIRGQTALGLVPGYFSLVYEPLMARSWDEPFALYPLIASSIVLAEDRSSITFNLNPAAHWSDGTPITADDILFSHQILRDKGRPNHRSYYKKVLSAVKNSETSVTFTFKKNADGSIDREMPLIIAQMPVLPQHDWHGRDFNQTSLRFPVGSGPYKVAQLDPGRSITYSRDKNYWGQNMPAQKGMYNFDTIKFDYFRDDGVALQAFKAGQYDLRREGNATMWATAYDFPAVSDQRVKLESFQHQRTEPAYGFIFNTREGIFKDKLLRDALQYSFDFAWVNRNLFHGQYKRIESFFPNSELAAPALPMERELEILQKFKTQLPSDIFTKPVRPPTTDGSEENMRANLLTAGRMLEQAGYVLRDNQLLAPQSNAPVTFEILLSDPGEEKVALTWIRALEQLGIHARAHTVDSAQYQARLAAFRFDVTINKWINSLSPGNEQITFWGSAAADQQGSRNYAGIKDPVVDALAAAIPATTSRDELIATAHALDRVLMAGHYTVPLYYLGRDNIAYWQQRIQHPNTMPLYGTVLESWWAVPSQIQ